MTAGTGLTVRSIRTTAVEVPMRHVLGTSQAAVRAAPLLLVDLETEEGITGHAYLFCYVRAAAVGIAAILGEIEEQARGQRVAPQDLWARLAKRFTLIGVQGQVRMALAGFDVACWDAMALAANQPLVSLLGGSPRRVRAYNSNGLGLMPLEKLTREAGELLDGGFSGIKLRLGYPTLEEDIAAVRAVRERAGKTVQVMVDYNQALSVAEALRRGHALDEEGVYWIEEPIRHDDYRGCARLAGELATPIQIGENFSQPFAMQQALDAAACDYVMPDLER
ncbi:MAG TPA: enolase C-terminal domain-like protein, partial [Usitatibacter sp.]|nr:enolase C-terminal domain-like protein [Usitatibacter sp.]